VELTKDATIAGRYQLGRLLGEGGMGAVWAATELVTGRSYALKFLNREDPTPRRRRRFLREARAAMALTHPNVVRIHEVIAEREPAADPTMSQWPCLVMDLLEGESLAARIERSPRMALEEFAPLFVQIVSAAGAAHASGVVHRDLKPANIFLVQRAREGESVRVLDFGIAKLTTELDGTSTSLTGTGDVLGTPHYMSPEQIFGEADIDHRTDVWSLGVIAFQCLSGAHPVSAENVGQVLKAITTGKLTPLARAAPQLPTLVTDLVDRMLSRDRKNRPRDLREVLETFSRFTTLRVPAIDAPRGTTADDSQGSARTAVGQETIDEPTDRARAGRGPRRWAIPLSFTLLAALFLGGVALANRARAPLPIASDAPHADVEAKAPAEANPPPSVASTAPLSKPAVTVVALVAPAGSSISAVASAQPPLRPKSSSIVGWAPPLAASSPLTTAPLSTAPLATVSTSTTAPPSLPSTHPSGGLITKAPF